MNCLPERIQIQTPIMKLLLEKVRPQIKGKRKRFKSTGNVHADQAGLADVRGNKLASELDSGEKKGEVTRGLLVVLDLVLEDVAGEGDEVGLGWVRHGE